MKGWNTMPTYCNSPMFLAFIKMVYLAIPIALGLGICNRILKNRKPDTHCDKKRVVILGAGAAGLSVAAQLNKKIGKLVDIILVEPNNFHYFQPGFTGIGFGENVEKVYKSTLRLVPEGIRWIQDYASGIDPIEQFVSFPDGSALGYDYLVVATGVELQLHKIIGLSEALSDPDSGVISVCSFKTARMAWEQIKKFRGGKFLSTMPNTPTKCPGVVQKVVLLMNHFLKKNGYHGFFSIFSPGNDCSIEEPYRGILEGKLLEIGTDIYYEKNLIKIRSPKTAIFRGPSGEIYEHQFDLMHVVPPMSAPSFLKNIADKDGYVAVDAKTLQHKIHRNIFAIGDCAGLPTRKTAAAVRKQLSVVTENIHSVIKGEEATKKYNGETCCPIPFPPGKTLMMEFDYDGKAPCFLNKLRPSRRMYLIKEYIIPKIYWQIMLRGF